MATLRLSRGEYWLLNNAIRAWTPFYNLADEPSKLAVDYNKKPHGMSRSELIDTLTDLFDRGWIVAPEGDAAGDPPVQLSRETITSYIDQRQFGWYGLTALGGAVWEAFAVPDWARYIDISWGNPADGGELIGGSHDLVRLYLLTVHYFGYHVVAGSQRQEEIRPWHPTYWKLLPVGYRTRFDFTYEKTHVDWGEIPHKYMTLNNWYEWR
jgi:hypothetical protein